MVAVRLMPTGSSCRGCGKDIGKQQGVTMDDNDYCANCADVVSIPDGATEVKDETEQAD